MSARIRVTAALLLALSIGLQWAVLQSVAWAGMFLRFSQRDSVATALVKTFDGQHPCQLCKVVRAGCQQDSTPAAPVSGKLKWASVDLFCLPVSWSPSPRLGAVRIVTDSVVLHDRRQRPLLPPPRCA